MTRDGGKKIHMSTVHHGVVAGAPCIFPDFNLSRQKTLCVLGAMAEKIDHT